MRLKKLISMISISVYICLFSVCRGASVDAPKTSTEKPELLSTTTVGRLRSQEHHEEETNIREESVKEGDDDTNKEGSHVRFPRSVPAPESVLNYLPRDYDSDNSETWPRGSRHVPRSDSYLTSHKLPDNSLSDPRVGTWQLEPQVGKRGKRVRGQSSSYYRQDPSHAAHAQNAEYQMMADSLDAVERGASTTMLARQQRNGRRYDVPQIGRRLH